MENIIKKAITAREINHKGQGLWVSMCILDGDLTQVCVKIISKLGMNLIAYALLRDLKLCFRYSLVENFKKNFELFDVWFCDLA